MNKKQRNRVLFKAHLEHARDSVVLNWHGRSIQEFGLYAEAYHKAGKRLVLNYGTTGAVRDFEATSILFLYRHAFELYLKAFVLVGSNLLFINAKKGMDQEKIFRTHKLSTFIPYFEAIIREVGWSWDMGVDGLRKKSDFVALVKEFESIDPNSYSFRYPTDQDGQGALPDHFTFNLSLFAQRIDPLLEVIDGGLMGLNEFWNSAAEAAYEAGWTAL
jgi:hypothetical protein